jgi:hypothetical protein
VLPPSSGQIALMMEDISQNDVIFIVFIFSIPDFSLINIKANEM